MNWVQRTVCAQQMLESVITAVAMGNMDANAALAQLQVMNVPVPECCSVIMSMYQAYPQGQSALDALSSGFGCNEIAQQMMPPAPVPEVEKPMQMPSVEIE